jgi:pyruvate/2-oxoglutarate dehydrogenase complex dihydrolipoamide dehydrogenase (E3) component
MIGNQYQVIVIGSGSAGQEACLKAARAGLRTLLVEERTLGSNSFHGGSHAVRALRACANYFKRTEKAKKFGTSLDLIETNWTNWLNAQRRNSGRLSHEFSQAIDREKVHLKFGRARLIAANEIAVLDPPRGLDLRITSNYIILATGSRPKSSSQPELGILNSDYLFWKGYSRSASLRHRRWVCRMRTGLHLSRSRQPGYPCGRAIAPATALGSRGRRTNSKGAFGSRRHCILK